jgi:hypothetical protein
MPGEVAVPGDPTEQPACKLGPSPFNRRWVLDEIELISLRFKRAGLVEMRLHERTALRAAACWDLDRRAEAEVIGLEIHRRPAEVASKLEQTTHGCQWMIERWAMLARAADRKDEHDPAAYSLDFDLLGTPIELREGAIGESIDTDGKLVGPAEDLGTFARRNVARLLLQQETLAEVDAFDRSTAEAGLTESQSEADKSLRRHEAALHRRLRWYVDLLGETSTSTAESPVEENSHSESSSIGPESEAEIDDDREEMSPTLPPVNRKDRRADRVERRRLAADRKHARRLG